MNYPVAPRCVVVVWVAVAVWVSRIAFVTTYRSQLRATSLLSVSVRAVHHYTFLEKLSCSELIWIPGS